MQVVGARSLDVFTGTEAEPRQVVEIVLRGTPRDGEARSRGAARAGDEAIGRVSVRGDGLLTEEPVSIGSLRPGEEARLEIGVAVARDRSPGAIVSAEVVVEGTAVPVTHAFDFVIAEPGWRMFMIAHFHYDPVWWNTQAAYTETWAKAIQYRQPFQEPGLALVKAHIETARRDPLYKFVLAELDYLKPYWDVYPEDREYVRQLLREGRLELVGGTYNEPNTNLTSAESTIRNAIYGIAYQRDVLGGAPATAWQLDVFGHDPQFPGIMADAGVTSSSWARGPFHEWGPHWVRGSARLPFNQLASGEPPLMQFQTEFDWVSPSGRALLTSFMADHYSAGWWMDSATTLEEAEAAVHALFTDLAALATTRNVLLPVGTDYSPPNRWLTAIQRDWNARYVWPKFVAAIPREFFDAVRAERTRTGRAFSPQTRDMNPIYTGKDVSFIDTKQAQRVAENTLLAAEKFATIAWLLGARFPAEAIDKAWRQLLFGAHHDGITGSESDQVYLDLLGGWREAVELGRDALDDAIAHIARRIDTQGEGRALVVFNPLSWARSDVVHVDVELPPGSPAGIEIRDETGRVVPAVVEAAEAAEAVDAADAVAGGGPARVALTFIARDVPALGHRTYRLVPSEGVPSVGWRRREGSSIESEGFAITVDPARGGAIVGLVDRRTGRQLIRDGGAANELLAYREYPNHPLFGEGPWHLTPDGRVRSSTDTPASVVVEESPIGRRLRVAAPFEACRREQTITLWDGIERVDLVTRIDEYGGHDLLFRVRFDAAVEGGRPVSEVGNAVVGRGFGRPNVDVAEVPFTLDNPAYNWFALGSTARIAFGAELDRAAMAIGIAEVIAPDVPEQDEAVRALVVALVRAGVTSTLTRDDGPRYGILHIDSNLPDVRLAIGGPAENAFTDAVLTSAGPAVRNELERQLRERGWGRVFIQADPRLDGPDDPIADRRGPRDLPVLVVAGADPGRTVEAVTALADDLADGTIEMDASPGGAPLERLDDYTVAVLNRGLPGFNVERDGRMYLSLMRSCSGWPSGVWINPPRRSTPDGANFQFQHWSHAFEYAIAAGDGDWRTAGIVRAGHEYNNPLVARVLEPHAGDVPATASFFAVEPPSAVVTALKPGGNGLARMASGEPGIGEDGERTVVMRLYESSGAATRARISSRLDLHDAERTNVLEEAVGRIDPEASGTSVELAPFEIATLRFDATVSGRSDANPGAAGVRVASEPAQPVFADYWMHNKGAAPLGYQPVTVQIRPGLLAGSGPFAVPVAVASERTDEPVAGRVSIVAPPGWSASPAERLFRLAPGAHVTFESSVSPPADAPPGRYFAAARLTDGHGQEHEDVVAIDLGLEIDPGPVAAASPAGTGGAGRSVALAEALERAIRGGEPIEDPTWSRPPAGDAGAGELDARLTTASVVVRAGERGEIVLSLRNGAASEIRGEAQLIGPHDTWAFTRPWTTGFAVGPGEDATLRFEVAPPIGSPPGTWWALVKVMYFGRLTYTESIPIVVTD